MLPGERWLDLGSNIGAFGAYALKKGAAYVFGVEAEAYNYLATRQHYAAHGDADRWSVLNRAVVADNYVGHTARFWVNYRPMLLRRHSLTKPPETKPARWAEVEVVRFSELTRGFDCVKMNIEGAEIELLENVRDWGDVRKLVFEYSFDKDPSIPRFLDIQARLRTHFRTVETRERIPNLKEWPFYPPSCFCFCSI